MVRTTLHELRPSAAPRAVSAAINTDTMIFKIFCLLIVVVNFQYVKDHFWNSGAKIRVIFDVCKKIPDQFIFGRGDFHICTKSGSGIGKWRS